MNTAARTVCTGMEWLVFLVCIICFRVPRAGESVRVGGSKHLIINFSPKLSQNCPNSVI